MITKGRKHVMKRISLGLCLLILLSPIAEARRVERFDDTARIPHFQQFAERFRRTVRERDADFIAGLMTKETLYTHGPGYDGPRVYHKLDDPNAQIWKDLEKVISVGAGWDAQRRRVLYPSFIVSNFGNHVVWASNVNLRITPSQNGRVLERLTWETVESAGSSQFFLDRQGDWCKVRSSTGNIGWVHSDYLYGQNSLCVALGNSGGRWRLLELIYVSC